MKAQTQKPYAGRNREFAVAMIRATPKSKNKARYDKKAERQRKQKGWT